MQANLERALTLLVDGEPIDWEGLLEDAIDERERACLVDLRGLAELDRVSTAPLAGSHGLGTGDVLATDHTATRPRWGHFELLEEIGKGAYGTVYRAWDTRLAREVALKLLDVDSGKGSLAEARRLARVSHSNVVAVQGADHHDGRVGLWMELLTGRTLDRILLEQGPFSARETIAIGLDLCSAAAAIHSAALVHRDIKAQNVMREPGGRLVLMDLGASVETPRDEVGVESLAGTPLYMAPELFQNGTATVASDIYAIGVVLYRLVTGAYPLEAMTIGDMRRAHASSVPLRPLREARPDLPRALVAVVERCLARDPRERFASAARLEAALHDADGRAPRSRWPYAGATAAASALACAALAVYFLTRPGSPTRPAGLIPQQLDIAQGFENLAASLAARGDWRQALERYRQAERAYRASGPPDSALVAQVLAKIAYVEHQAGDLKQAQDTYLLAISKFQSNFADHPLLEIAYTGLAAVEQSMGQYEEAARSIERALRMRARVLIGAASASIDGALTRRIARLAPSFRIDRDEDGDWIPDLLEAAIGSDPRSPDTDGNGVSDGDETPNDDGATNFVRFGLISDSSKAFAHYGAVDPQTEGFLQPANRPFIGRPVGSNDLTATAWKIPSVGQSFYYFPLADAQRADAMARGWRLLTRGRLYAGIGLTSVDFAPDGPRFDINFVPHSHDVDIQLSTSVVPYEGMRHTLRGTEWPLTQLEYRPDAKSAFLIVNGAIVDLPPYRGHTQFQENLGLFFGGFNEIVNVPKSDADFSVAMLVVR
jgi:tetratricopeptide (TPR) repeat protein